MGQKINKWLIARMGNWYVKLDKTIEHERGPILGLDISEDFENMSRYELCCHIEDKFLLPRESFWKLQSTQKIRWCSEVARRMQTGLKVIHSQEE